MTAGRCRCFISKPTRWLCSTFMSYRRKANWGKRIWAKPNALNIKFNLKPEVKCIYWSLLVNFFLEVHINLWTVPHYKIKKKFSLMWPRPKSETKAHHSDVTVSVNPFSNLLSCLGVTWWFSHWLMGKGSQSYHKDKNIDTHIHIDLKFQICWRYKYRELSYSDSSCFKMKVLTLSTVEFSSSFEVGWCWCETIVLTVYKDQSQAVLSLLEKLLYCMSVLVYPVCSFYRK